MFHVKVVLRQKKNKDGLMPLAIRITKDRKTSFIHIANVPEKDWDAETQRVKKSHVNSVRLNNLILTKLADANNKALEMETQASLVSSKAVKQKIKPTGGSSFFGQADLYIANLKEAGKYNRYTADKPLINRFREFLKGSDIAFPDITVSLINRFQTYLKGCKTIGARSAVNHLVVIRSVFSQAIAAGITDVKYYPFGKGKIKIKFPDSLKIGFSAEEVKRIEEAVLAPNSYEDHARNLWLYSFYFGGMRGSDVLRTKWTDFNNGRLHYTMGKNLKGGSLKISEKVLAIISKYEDQKRSNDDFVFPDLKVIEDLTDTFVVQRKIANTISRVDKYLKNYVARAAEIDKPLTMHIARHTFGNISGDKIPVQMLQKLYRHSDIKTTIGYQANFIHKDADEALNAVIGF